jgi:hypothetical protein
MKLKTGIVAIPALIASIAVVGCAPTQGQLIAIRQDMAIQTAVSRAQFEMDCQEVTPVLISEEMVQPVLQKLYVNGSQRAEYTIGVSGCDKRTTFIVICLEGEKGCLAAAPDRFYLSDRESTHEWKNK